jgi:hypothetical protein
VRRASSPAVSPQGDAWSSRQDDGDIMLQWSVHARVAEFHAIEAEVRGRPLAEALFSRLETQLARLSGRTAAR